MGFAREAWKVADELGWAKTYASGGLRARLLIVADMLALGVQLSRNVGVKVGGICQCRLVKPISAQHGSRQTSRVRDAVRISQTTPKSRSDPRSKRLQQARDLKDLAFAPERP